MFIIFMDLIMKILMFFGVEIGFLRKHYILQEEFIGEHVRINLIGKEFIIFSNELWR